MYQLMQYDISWIACTLRIVYACFKNEKEISCYRGNTLEYLYSILCM